MPKKEKKMNIPSTPKTETPEATEGQQPEVTEAKEQEQTNQEQNTQDQAQVTDEVKTEVTEEAKPKVSVEGAFSEADRIPANWTITPTEDGIEAFNGTTGSRFEGSIADFNAKLKG
jgi:hypothetical protein